MTPGALPREKAAAFVGVSPGTFDKEVARGIWPPALPLPGRKKRWSRKALQDAIDRYHGGLGENPDKVMAELDSWVP